MDQIGQQQRMSTKPVMRRSQPAVQSYRLPRRILVCVLVGLMTASAVSDLADPQVYGYVAAPGMMQLNHAPTEAKFPLVRPTGRQFVSGIELARAVTRAAHQHHLHPALLLAVMKAESSFNPVVVSKAGAVGLMQLVPETAMRHGVRNLYDTDENVAGGARHLRYLLDRFRGNMRLALAAYNAGERKVDRYKQIPPYKETRHYVQKVISYYRDYRKEARLLPLGERHHEVYKIRTL